MTDPMSMEQSSDTQELPAIAGHEDLEMQPLTGDATITHGLVEAGTAIPAEPSVAAGVAPKKVFSLFLSPEERKLKMEREAAAAREAAASKAAKSATPDAAKRGRKVKKVVHNIFAPPSSGNPSPVTNTAVSDNISAGASTKTAPIKLSAHVPGTGDPSLAPHPFFAEMGKDVRTATQVADNELEKFIPRYNWSSSGEPAPYPSHRFQYHGPATVGQLHQVVGEMCGLLVPLPDQCKNNKRVHKDFGWYTLRTLGDTPMPGTSQQQTTEAWIGRVEPKWTARSESGRSRQRTRSDHDAHQHASFQRTGSFDSCRRFTEALVASSGPPLLLAGKDESLAKGQNSFEGKPGDLWIDKYKPRSGADVLGNRHNTGYLTRWLKGLEVSAWSLGPDDPHHPNNINANNKRSISGIGRPKKRTRRSKARGDDLDDFIVDDDFGDDYYGSDGDQGEEAFAPQPNLSPFARYASDTWPIGDTTHNSRLDAKVEIRSNIILLSGPSGSGKTAAVYACAEESGYEVFEVSPGSKRAGRDVLALVGEMAENHHVHVVASGTGTNSTNNSAPNTPASTASANGESFSKRSKEIETSSTRTVPTDQAQQPSVYNLLFKKFKPKRREEDTVSEEQEALPVPESEVPAKEEDVKEEDVKEEDVKKEDVKESLVDEEIDVGEEAPPVFQEDSLADFLSLLATTNPRQSLILLEEVDVLFEDDKGFWGGIATLAAKSKRPIVMTCNDPMLIPPGVLKVQEHLKFDRPCSSELFQYLECVCRKEGHVYTPGTLESLIEEGHRDTRRILMQLQFSACAPSKEDTPKAQQPASPPPGSTRGRKGPQRLFRITSKGVQSATAPSTTPISQLRSLAAPLKGRPTALTAEQIEGQFKELVKLSNNLSLVDSSLEMDEHRAFQHFENDQEEPLKDDEQGVRFVFKEPTSGDHLSWDLEIAELVEDGARAVFNNQVAMAGGQRASIPDIPEYACIHTDGMNNYDTQPPDELSRFVSQVAPSFEHILTVQNLYHKQRDIFNVYASALRDMVLADDLNSTIPSGRRSMRSNGGLPRRHLPLQQAERSALSSTSFDDGPH